MAKRKSTSMFGSTSGGAGAGIGIGTTPPADIYAPIKAPVKPPPPIGGVTPGGGVGLGSAGSTFTNKPAGGAGAKVSLVPGLGGVGPKSDLGFLEKQMQYVKDLAKQKDAKAKDKILKDNEGKGFAPSEATDEELADQQGKFKLQRQVAISKLKRDIRDEVGPEANFAPGTFNGRFGIRKKGDVSSEESGLPKSSTFVKGFSINKKRANKQIV